jgi:integrase
MRFLPPRLLSRRFSMCSLKDGRSAEYLSPAQAARDSHLKIPHDQSTLATNNLASGSPAEVEFPIWRRPRHDLKRPWDAVTKRVGLTGVRLHDLRHTYASFGAGGGLGLPIIGRLLGHTQAATTARCPHLDNDPLRSASEAIAGRIAAALEGNPTASVRSLRRSA